MQRNKIRLGVSHRDIRLTAENRKLSSSSSPAQLLAPDSAIVDESGLSNIIGVALSSLIVLGKSPRVSLALLCNDKAAVSTSGNTLSINFYQCQRDQPKNL